MSAITPDTEIRLLHCDLSMDELNQLTFSNATAQANYFKSLTHDTVQDNCTYLRKEGIIRYPKNIDTLLRYNYVMYKNNNFSDKWFYAFIEKMEFINPNMTEIKIKTDVFQTWQFQIQYKKCFVEREHVNDDTIGLHTIPEGLETGDYIVEGSTEANYSSAHAVIAATYDIVHETGGGALINGIYQASVFYLIRGEIIANAEQTIKTILGKFDNAGKADSIIGIFMVPDELTKYDTITNWDTFDSGFIYSQYKILNHQFLNSTASQDMGVTTITKPYSTVDGYTPKNNKLFVYPYKVLLGTNNQGSSAEYRYEFFSTSNCTFQTNGCISPGCSIKTRPKNYKGKSENFEEGLISGKYPIGSYNSDLYINWLTQNAVNIGVGIVGSGVSIAAGAITGNPIGVASGIVGIGQSLGQIYEHSKIPPQARGNTNAGDVTYTLEKCNFTFNKLTIKNEYAKIIDQFFSMYGYKVNTVKVPNINGRSNWNYVKTIDCNIEGNIPQDDLIELKSLFNKGLTLWHNPSTFLDYSQSNNIV